MAAVKVIVWDFERALAEPRAEGYVVRDAARTAVRQTPRDVRLGIVAELPAPMQAADLRLLLRDALLEEPFDQALLLNVASLPVRATDPRCFAMVAAVAQTPPESVEYVTSNPATAAAARAAGFRVADPPEGAAGASLLVDIIDEDTGPAFVLRGRVVTMNRDKVIDNARVAIDKGVIVAVLEPSDALPAAFVGKPEVDTQATIYPGLIDLHNHFAFNIHQLWKVPKKYNNRSAWQRDNNYQKGVRNATAYLAKLRRTAEAMARYVEAKAILGGVTSGQGIRMKVAKFTGLAKGLMRNIEITGDDRLPEAGTRIPDLFTEEKFEDFGRALESRRMFYHLSEGTSDKIRDHFLNLQSRSLLKPNLVAIHALGLKPGDFTALGAGKSKVVWSPFSNLLLYGATLDPAQLKTAGIDFAIGCDWSPSGGKNMLHELKVARWASQRNGTGLTDRELVECATAAPARLLGWDAAVGKVQKGFLADLFAVSGISGDPWTHLVDATEKEVALVTIHGIPRYGEPDVMEVLVPKGKLERASIKRRQKSFFFEAQASTLNGVSLKEATARLKTAMANLSDIRDEVLMGGPDLLGLVEAEFEIVLDMPDAPPDDTDALDATLLAPEDGVLESMPLDQLWVTSEDQGLAAAQINLPTGLADDLGKFYE